MRIQLISCKSSTNDSILKIREQFGGILYFVSFQRYSQIFKNEVLYSDRNYYRTGPSIFKPKS